MANTNNSGPSGTGAENAGISHSPLDLGTGRVIQIPALEIAGLQSITAAGAKRTKSAATSGRITHLKTFFTRLHSGAIEFLDEQIATWLEENPEIEIKHTNVVIGEVQAKKTEQNIKISKESSGCSISGCTQFAA